MSPLTAAFATTGLLTALDGLFVKAGFHSWLTWIDKPALLGLSPIKAQFMTFVIALIIMLLSAQNSKNDRYSTRMPILTYSWIFVFTIFCARFLTDNFNSFLVAILVMAYIIAAFVYKTIRGN
jgi:glucose-6-phosphate-specific signal transduction histidine kinase